MSFALFKKFFSAIGNAAARGRLIKPASKRNPRAMPGTSFEILDLKTKLQKD